MSAHRRSGCCVDSGRCLAAAASAGLFSSADAALSSFSKARAEEIAPRARPAPQRLLVILEDPPRYLNTALLLRMLVRDRRDRAGHRRDARPDRAARRLRVRAGDRRRPLAGDARLARRSCWSCSFVVIGVAPRTLGRQHSERVALLSAGPLIAFTKVLGPLPRLLILVGNAITPGRGFSEGPFASEAELRELVDLAEASSVIESGERQMIHSVFELGDTLVARGDGAAHRRGLHRAQQDPAAGDVAGAAQRLLPDPGGRREPRRHRRLRLPQGRHQAGLRPARGRDRPSGSSR